MITGIILVCIGSSYLLIFLVKRILRFTKIKLTKIRNKFSNLFKVSHKVKFIKLEYFKEVYRN